MQGGAYCSHKHKGDRLAPDSLACAIFRHPVRGRVHCSHYTRTHMHLPMHIHYDTRPHMHAYAYAHVPTLHVIAYPA